MINYTVSSMQTLARPDLTFVPFRGNFEYGNEHFISRNVREIIPTGAQLTKFIDEDEVASTPQMSILIRAAKMMTICGFPENAPEYLVLKPGIPDSAFKHLVWMSSESTIELITSGMELDEREKEGWWLTVFAFLLDQWIELNDIYKLIYFSEPLFHPSKLAVVDDDTDEAWGFIKSENIHKQTKAFGFDTFDEAYNRAKKILPRFHFYGGNEKFYQALQFHSFLPPISTYSIVTKWIQDKTKEGMHVAATLMAFYMPLDAINNCSDALK